MDIRTRAILPVMEPDGQPIPDTHLAVLDPITNRHAWVERRWADAWVKRRLDKRIADERQAKAQPAGGRQRTR